MIHQITGTILMVRPTRFHRNAETAVNNYFQPKEDIIIPEKAQELAAREFDGFVDKLRREGVEVIVYNDHPDSESPDSIFPNNWISTHSRGTIYLYPMYAVNRRRERREDIVDELKRRFAVSNVHSFIHWEEREKYLEGTGSLILDRPQKIAYAALAERTENEVLEEFSAVTAYEVVKFKAYQSFEEQRLPIYHTNVMMSVGEEFAVICEEAIDDPAEREQVINRLRTTGKEVIPISESQRDQFAGNILQVRTQQGQRVIAMSEAAFRSFNDAQLERLGKHGKIVYSDLTTIETLGGGSARCMMAEIFLPQKS